jgi:alkylation response protein AidB-like acyl-CoA dehydrogenase
MNVTLSDRQRAIGTRFDQLFDTELRADLRRMGNRELGAGAVAPLDDDETDARQAVWQTLCDLGALRPAGEADGLGLAEQVILAEKIGAALYQSPWADTALAIDIATAAGRGDLAARMAAGEAVAVAVRERARDEPDRPGSLGQGPDLRAVRQFVAFAADVSWFLVVADGRLLLVPGDHPNVSWRRHDDIGRGDFYHVTFDGVPAADAIELTASGAWDAALTHARIRHAAQLVGAAQAALDETVAYARERRQFGQPIGRFQAPAFRLADLSTRIHAARLLVHLAAWQADQGHDARLSAYEALATAADLIRTAGTEADQLHGAVGMTEEHDAQLVYRRAAVDALLWGRPTELRRRAAALLAEAYRTRG